jgi:signal transduction histidine kinase
VLRVCRYASLTGTGVLSLALLSASARGQNVSALVVELALWIGGSVLLWLARNKSQQVGGVIVAATFLPACLAALTQFGPLMGTGAMFLTWVMITVFLLDALVVPLILLMVVLFGTGVLISNGVLRVQWPFLADGLAGWARVCVTTWSGAASLGYVFRHLLRRLVSASQTAAAARSLRKAERDERRAKQRLELLGTLAGGVAHDFNNILTVMSASLESLRHAHTDTERAALLDELDASSEAARATTRQLLSFSRQGESPSGAADPMRSLPNFANTLRRILPASISLACDLERVPAVAIATGALE